MARHSGDARSSRLGRKRVVYRRVPGGLRTQPAPPIGTRYGEVLVTGYRYGPRGGITAIRVQCSCRGRQYWVSEQNLRHGRTTRCFRCAQLASGAARKRFWGYADIVADSAHRERLLNRISAIEQRCESPSARGYVHYGGRGIRLWSAWTKGHRREFLRYLVTLPGWDNPDLELDREDNSRGYEPGNLRFTTRQVNVGNRRKIAELQQRIFDLEARLRHCQCGAAASIHHLDLGGTAHCE